MPDTDLCGLRVDHGNIGQTRREIRDALLALYRAAVETPNDDDATSAAERLNAFGIAAGFNDSDSGCGRFAYAIAPLAVEVSLNFGPDHCESIRGLHSVSFLTPLQGAERLANAYVQATAKDGAVMKPAERLTITTRGEETACDHCGWPIYLGDYEYSADDWQTIACCAAHAHAAAERSARNV